MKLFGLVVERAATAEHRRCLIDSFESRAKVLRGREERARRYAKSLEDEMRSSTRALIERFTSGEVAEGDGQVQAWVAVTDELIRSLDPGDAPWRARIARELGFELLDAWEAQLRGEKPKREALWS